MKKQGSIRGAKVRDLTGRYVLLILWSLFTLVPLYSAFVASTTPNLNLGEAMVYPKYFTMDNYRYLFTDMNIMVYFKATMIYSVFSSLVIVFLGALAAYAVTRYRFKGRSVFTVSLMVMQILPQVIIIIPIYMIISKIGLFDTYLGVLIPLIASTLPYPIMLMMNFFKTIPFALEEAAIIDGCSRFQILIRIVLPLALPGIMTAFSMAFFSGWGQYLFPMILTVSDHMVPLTLAMSRLIDNVPPWEVIMAGSLFSVVPAVLLYILAQKYVVQGLTAGGVK